MNREKKRNKKQSTKRVNLLAGEECMSIRESTPLLVNSPIIKWMEILYILNYTYIIFYSVDVRIYKSYLLNFFGGKTTRSISNVKLFIQIGPNSNYLVLINLWPKLFTFCPTFSCSISLMTQHDISMMSTWQLYINHLWYSDVFRYHISII